MASVDVSVATSWVQVWMACRSAAQGTAFPVYPHQPPPPPFLPGLLPRRKSGDRPQELIFRISKLLRAQLEESGFDDDIKDLAKGESRAGSAAFPLVLHILHSR